MSNRPRSRPSSAGRLHSFAELSGLDFPPVNPPAPGSIEVELRLWRGDDCEIDHSRLVDLQAASFKRFGFFPSSLLPTHEVWDTVQAAGVVSAFTVLPCGCVLSVRGYWS